MTTFDISPAVKALIGANYELAIGEAAHASDPVCWTCNKRIHVASELRISVIARHDKAHDIIRVGYSHASCAPSRVEHVSYDVDELQDAYRDATFTLVATPTFIAALMEFDQLLSDPRTGESLNQAHLRTLGCVDITDPWPQLDPPTLPGWTRRVNLPTLEILLPGGESIGQWPLGPIAATDASCRPLILLIGERIGLDNFDETRLAMSIAAGAVVGGRITPTGGLLQRVRAALRITDR